MAYPKASWQNFKWMSISGSGNFSIKIIQCLLDDWLSFFIELQHVTHTVCACVCMCMRVRRICFVSSQLIAFTSIVNRRRCTAVAKKLQSYNSMAHCSPKYGARHAQPTSQTVCDAMYDWNRIQTVSTEHIVFPNVSHWMPIDLLCLFIYLIRFFRWFAVVTIVIGIVGVFIVVVVVCCLWQ